MNKQFKSFFEDKNILVTGHTGFIGSWLSIWLNELGANVIGYALPSLTKDDNCAVTNLNDKIISIIYDIRNFEKLNDAFKEYKPEIVFHFAAQPILRTSYNIPKDTYDINVGGTVNVFEAFRKNNFCKILINFTTDKCYENREWIWGYREKDRLGGYDPYSSSKACSELITTAYRKSFFSLESSQKAKMVSSVRSGNVIGGGDWQQDRLIPDCMRALKNDQLIRVRSPQSIRPWMYVLEPIRGCLILAMEMWSLNETYSGSWNFGSDSNSIFTVSDIVEKVIQYWGKGSFESIEKKEIDDLHESKLLFLDSFKSNRILNWRTFLNMDEIIKLTCDWYKEEQITYDFDIKQIKYYLKKVNE